MSDLINPLDLIIQQASQLKPQNNNLDVYRKRIDGTGCSNRNVILIDISGSMGDYCHGTRKIELVKQALSQQYTSEILIAFNSFVEVISDLSLLPEPKHTTALDLGIRAARQYYPRHTLIISDGEPDCKATARTEASLLTGRISTLYIGPDHNNEAIAFMRELAQLGCGSCGVCDISQIQNQALLKPQITALLPGGL